MAKVFTKIRCKYTGIIYKYLDVERTGEHFVPELVSVERCTGPDDLIGFHPPELEPVMVVITGTLEDGRVALRHLDHGVLVCGLTRGTSGRPAVGPDDQRSGGHQQLQQ